MHTASQINVNLSAVQHNMRLLRHIIGRDCAICPIIKSDAYGLGAVRMAQALVAEGAELLAVYTPQEASRLIASAVGGSVLVLMPLRDIPRTDELYRGFVCGRLHLTIHDEEHLNCVIALAEQYGVTIPVHLEIDTGMTRGGCDYHRASDLMQRINHNEKLVMAGVFTHFAGADENEEFTSQQLAKFEKIVRDNEALLPADCYLHAANTAATLRNQRYHQSMVRVGLGWVGYGMEMLHGGEIIPEGEKLQPSITWSSRIIHLRSVAPGTPVGYGSTWRTERKSVIGLVPVGYADGYPSQLGTADTHHPQGWVRVLCDQHSPEEMSFAPVVGAVSMDQITLDLTDIAPKADLAVGTSVEIITPDQEAPNHLPRLAQAAGLVPHELLCALNPRIKRAYQMSVVDQSYSGPSSQTSAAAG